MIHYGVNFPSGQGSGAGCGPEGSGPQSRGQFSRNVPGGCRPDGGSTGREPGMGNFQPGWTIGKGWLGNFLGYILLGLLLGWLFGIYIYSIIFLFFSYFFLLCEICGHGFFDRFGKGTPALGDLFFPRTYTFAVPVFWIWLCPVGFFCGATWWRVASNEDLAGRISRSAPGCLRLERAGKRDWFGFGCGGNMTSSLGWESMST